MKTPKTQTCTFFYIQYNLINMVGHINYIDYKITAINFFLANYLNALITVTYLYNENCYTLSLHIENSLLI